MADPRRLPERLALFAVRAESGRAAALVARVHRDLPDATSQELRAEVVTRGTRLTVLEGSVIGGPFVLLIPVAFCAALLVQIRMVLALAVLDERDPADRERVVELLVLQGAHPTEQEAAAALTAAERAEPVDGRRQNWLVSVRRLAYLLGVIGGGGPSSSRLRAVAGWVSVAAVIVIGFVLPLIWVPAMGISYQRATTRLGQRSCDYYHPEPRIILGPQGGWRPAGALIAVRTFLGAVLPVVSLLVVLVAGVRVGESRWAALAVGVVAASLVGATIAAVRHLHRHRNRRRR